MRRSGASKTDRKTLLQAERSYGEVRPAAGGLFVALAFPNRYSIGMSNLGFQTIHRRIEEAGPFAVERVFLPESDGQPLRTLETGRPVGGADVAAFSISFENDYVHFLRMLRAAKIPLRREEREDRHPIVLVGGASTFLNPEPLRSFVDIFLLGEGEESVGEYLCLRMEDRGKPRRTHLERAARIDGAYVPDLHDRSAAIERRRYDRVADDPAVGRVVTPHAEFGNTLLVEISRGCPKRCRFCTVGTVFPRFRMVPPVTVVDLVERFHSEDESRGRVPLRKVGLVSSAFFDHTGAEEIARELHHRGYEIGISSVRVDRLSESVLRVLRDGGLRTLTIAPEAGTGRLREKIGKKASDEAILEGVEKAGRAGFPAIRIYYMVGLPFETEEDRAGIVRLTGEIRERFRTAAGRPGKVTVSLHPFVPKPRTPFQWSRMLRPKELSAILAALRKDLRGLTVKTPPLKEVYIESILAMGGEELGGFLVRLADGERWDRAAASSGIDLDELLFRDRSPERAAPWAGETPDHVDQVNRREWARAARTVGGESE